MKRSIHIGTILGIPIEVNYTWFIIFGLVTWTLAIGYFPAALPFKPAYVYWIMGLISAAFLFVSLLLHELSHSYVAIRNHLSIQGITLFIFGGMAHMAEEPSDPGVELKMAAAGPVSSIIMSMFFLAVTQLLDAFKLSMPVIAITNYLFMINLMVAIFNLIPGFPLDGGRILRATLWYYYKDIKKATRIASALGQGFAFFLIAVGFLYLFNRSLLSGIWLIFIGLFLQEAAETSYHQVLLQKALVGTRVKDIMTATVITVREDIPLDLLIDNFFFKFRFTSFPVINGMETISGLITLHNVRDIPKEKWNATYVKEAMVPIDQDLLTGPDVDVMKALGQMIRNKVGRLIVVEDHKLVGILSQRDVMRLFEVRSDLTK